MSLRHLDSAAVANKLAVLMASMLVLGGLSRVSAEDNAAAKPAAKKPAATKPAPKPHQVVVCYFHRTVRCPTCQKIGGYLEESIKTDFASQLKDGTVKLKFIDFEDKKNEKYTKAYHIEGPTLVLLDVRNGKVTSWKTGTEIWSLVGSKPEFLDYIRSEVHAYLDGQPAKSEKSDKGK